jgi:toxin ParE1/3/4
VRIEWLPVAVRTLQGQLAYIGERSPVAAIDIGDAIEAAVGRLADYPRSGRPGTRELAVGGTPFVIAYRVETKAVIILRLLHGAQRWPDQL